MDLSTGCFEKITLSDFITADIYTFGIGGLYPMFCSVRPVVEVVVAVVVLTVVVVTVVVMSASLVHTKRNHLVLLHVGNFKKSNGCGWIQRCKKIVWGCVLGFHILNPRHLVHQTRCGAEDW